MSPVLYLLVLLSCSLGKVQSRATAGPDDADNVTESTHSTESRELAKTDPTDVAVLNWLDLLASGNIEQVNAALDEVYTAINTRLLGLGRMLHWTVDTVHAVVRAFVNFYLKTVLLVYNIQSGNVLAAATHIAQASFDFARGLEQLLLNIVVGKVVVEKEVSEKETTDASTSSDDQGKQEDAAESLTAGIPVVGGLVSAGSDVGKNAITAAGTVSEAVTGAANQVSTAAANAAQAVGEAATEAVSSAKDLVSSAVGALNPFSWFSS